jgi:hypothetical protein
VGHGWASSYRHSHRNRGISRLRHEINKDVYARYGTGYVRHYSHDKYREQMEKYRSHKIKSRPNGQKRCNIPCRVFFSVEENHVAFCRYRPPTYRVYPYLREGRVVYHVKKLVDEKRADEMLPKIYR